MYLRPHDLLVMTAVGLTPTAHTVNPYPTPTSEVVRQQRRRRRAAALRRLLGRMLLRAGVRLLRSARRATLPAPMAPVPACGR